jgi:hypothetical protein
MPATGRRSILWDECVYSSMTVPDMKRLWWFIPMLLTVHNIEEALTMPQWMSVHLPMLRETILFMDEIQFSSKQLYLSLLFVTIIPFLVIYVCQRGASSQRKTAVMLILQSIIFWNALMPHISGVFVLGMYNPGTITASLFNIPFSMYLYRRVRQAGIVSNAALQKCIFAGLITYLPIVYFNHLIAQTISHFI